MISDNIVVLVNLPTVLNGDLSVFKHSLQRERVHLKAAHKEWNKQTMRLNSITKLFDLFIHIQLAFAQCSHYLDYYLSSLSLSSRFLETVNLI